MKSMTQNELAAALGITPAQVSQLKRRGMPTDDVARAQRWRNRHLQTGRMKGIRRLSPTGQPEPRLQAQPVPQDPATSMDDVDLFDEPEDDYQEVAIYKHARSRREHFQAEMARIALEKEVGKLMQADEVLQMVRDVGITLRTGLEDLGVKLAPTLAHITDEGRIRIAIDSEVERMLAEVSRRFEALAAQHTTP